MQRLNIVELGPHNENSRSVPSFCCHGNNSSHLTLATMVWVHITHVFEMFLIPLIFVYLDCKFSLRNSHVVYIFELQCNCTNSKWRILKKSVKIGQNSSSSIIITKLDMKPNGSTFANLLVI